MICDARVYQERVISMRSKSLSNPMFLLSRRALSYLGKRARNYVLPMTSEISHRPRAVQISAGAETARNNAEIVARQLRYQSL